MSFYNAKWQKKLLKIIIFISIYFQLEFILNKIKQKLVTILSFGIKFCNNNIYPFGLLKIQGKRSSYFCSEMYSNTFFTEFYQTRFYWSFWDFVRYLLHFYYSVIGTKLSTNSWHFFTFKIAMIFAIKL